jgi:hypothetical protein
MSHCRDFEEALWEAAEGRPLSAEAEAHLRTCASCRAAAQRLAEASQGFAALRAVEAPDPSAAVWGRVARPKRRPVFTLAWAAGAVACAVATTFALWHRPAPPSPITVPSVRVAQAPPQAPVGPQVEAPAPEQQRVAVEEPGPPANVRTGAQEKAAGGTGRLVSTPPRKRMTQGQREHRPPAAVQTPEGGTTVVKAAADDSCSEAAALAYRAIGRGLVARFLSSGSEAGQVRPSAGGV